MSLAITIKNAMRYFTQQHLKEDERKKLMSVIEQLYDNKLYDDSKWSNDHTLFGYFKLAMFNVNHIRRNNKMMVQLLPNDAYKDEFIYKIDRGMLLPWSRKIPHANVASGFIHKNTLSKILNHLPSFMILVINNRFLIYDKKITQYVSINLQINQDKTIDISLRSSTANNFMANVLIDYNKIMKESILESYVHIEFVMNDTYVISQELINILKTADIPELANDTQDVYIGDDNAAEMYTHILQALALFNSIKNIDMNKIDKKNDIENKNVVRLWDFHCDDETIILIAKNMIETRNMLKNSGFEFTVFP